MYTHHQKTVICDAPFEEDEGLRRIIAFIGKEIMVSSFTTISKLVLFQGGLT